jgi:hypothetical protein
VKLYSLHLSLEDNELSVMGGSNPSTESRTKIKCIAQSSVQKSLTEENVI